MRRQTMIAVTTLALSLTLVACGNDEPDESGTDTGQDTVDDTSQMDVGSDTSDTGTDTTDTTGDDTTDTESDEDTTPSYDTITSFEYRKVDEGGNTTRTGVRINLNANNPRIVKIDANNRETGLTDEEFQTLNEEYMTDEVREKMEGEEYDGDDQWECGSEEKVNGARYEFESQHGTQLSAPEPIQIISGCIPSDSTQPDAELVQRLRDKLLELRDQKF